MNELEKNKDRYKDSYRRSVSIRAWRSELIDKLMTEDAGAFFKEAHNDVLMSHVLARQGAWRVALMSLRSCIENILFGLYYHQHPVELELWELGKNKLGCAESLTYLSNHPTFLNIDDEISGIAMIKREYSTLSKAVHGSAKSFRMTKSGLVKGLNIPSEHEFGAWLSREKNTLIGINEILLTFFHKELQGASRQNLRKAISLAIPDSKHVKIKQELNVSLRNIPKQKG